MRASLAILVIWATALPLFAQDKFVLCEMTNATHTLQVEMRIPGFPHPEGFSWRFRPADQGDGISPVGPAFFPGTHSRQSDWRVSLVPKGPTLPGTNMLYELTWRIRDFTSGSVVTNQANLNIPLGKDFTAQFNGVRVEGKWNIQNAEQDAAHIFQKPRAVSENGER
jgi:hypothetical protein